MASVELVVKIIAWIDIVISSLCFAIVSIFALLLVAVPEFINTIVAEDLNEDQETNHREIEKFIHLDVSLQALILIGLLCFWGAYFTFSVLLLRWTKRNYLLGLRGWFFFRLVMALLFFPLDLYWMYPDVETTDVILFIIFNAYDVFSLCCVWFLMRRIVSIRGESRQIVGFQVL